MSPAGQARALGLCEQAAVEEPRLVRWLEAEAFVKQGAQSLVSFGDGLAETECTFRFHCEAPERLVQRVHLEASLGCLEGSPCPAGFEPVTSDLLEHIDERRAQSSYFPLAPGVVRASERLSMEQPQRALHQRLRVFGFGHV